MPGESNKADWRELCAAAADEPDSEKLACLVGQILQAFDETDHHATEMSRGLALASREG
jgi:hypothetical protein